MVLIPEGYFLMGGEGSENTPRHEGVVGRIYLDKHEVTVAAYEECVSAGLCQPMRKDNPFCNTLFPDRQKHPVNCIDWNDAVAHCKRLGKRLPREVEWEYAARGGSEQRLYSWGSDEPSRENGCYMHEGGSCEVASYAPGAFGLYDMTGNVWEWTDSFYGPYPAEAETGLFKVYRGGSWSRRFAKWMRNDLRNRYRVDEQSGALGFRCAKDPATPVCPKDAAYESGRCVRKAGDPLCEPGYAFAGGACRPGGVLPASMTATGTVASGSLPAASASQASAAPVDPTKEVPMRMRSPSFDKDCEKNFPGKSTAYQWKGGTFQAREPLIAAAGCKKRDIGVGWSSACCP
jgi:iron(II)-dependent oxidoreductase